jgi:hypothetical protein
MLNGEPAYLNFIRKSVNANKPFSVGALKEYVSNRVAQLSENTQEPIIRPENIDFDWNWCGPAN